MESQPKLSITSFYTMLEALSMMNYKGVLRVVLQDKTTGKKTILIVRKKDKK